MHAFRSRFRLTTLASLVLSVAARGAFAKGYTLAELLEMARRANPGVTANAQATEQIQAQVLEAKLSYLPTGELNSLIAPSPDIHCTQATTPVPPGLSQREWNERNCVSTDVPVASISHGIGGIFTRTEVRLYQPVYTFGKLSSALRAARAGVEASRGRETIGLADLELNVRKAYFGAKLARELESTLKEGIGFLDEAQTRIQKDLDEGSGSVSVTDKLRLVTTRAEIDARVLEARKGSALAREGLRALLGSAAPDDLEVDDAPLEALDVTVRPLSYYEEQARLSRPEVHALTHLVAAKRALADFEWRKQLPDLLIVGSATAAYASNVDYPRNAFFNNPFNTFSAGIAGALRFNLDIGPRYARSVRVRAEADEAESRRREALGGIAFDVARAHGDLSEASDRMKVTARGQKSAQSWIAAVAQNLEVGLAEAKDFSDALLAFFQQRVRHIQAVYDFDIAAATLTRATGSDVVTTRTPPPAENAPTKAAPAAPNAP